MHSLAARLFAARGALVALLAVLLLAGCATPLPAPLEPRALLRDEAFPPPAAPVGAEGLFAVSDEMRAFLQQHVLPQARRSGLQRALIDALNDRARLKLEYEGSATRTAPEAFAARAGNCLSLVAMTAALARELGLPVSYRSVLVEELWSRQGELVLGSRHVNLVLGRPIGAGTAESQGLVVDFLPPEELRGLRSLDLSEQTLTAMYLNNRAAETLAEGRVAQAYWWARAAVQAAPAYSAAWNTLAVVYLRRGLLDDAAAVLQQMLAREPDHTKALANLALLRERQGRAGEARQLQARLAALEPLRPFAHFDEGLARLRSGDYAAARDAFRRELRRDADYHEFHHWLGIAHLLLGELPAGRRHIETALRNSPTARDRSLYAGKLEAIAALVARQREGADGPERGGRGERGVEPAPARGRSPAGV